MNRREFLQTGGALIVSFSVAYAFHHRIIKALQHPLPPGHREEPPTRPLTEREIEILRLIAKGLSNNEAAKVLSLSRATVRTHLEHIYDKLEVTNRVEAVTEGLRKGLIEV